MIEFFVIGLPKSQPRHRHYARRSKEGKWYAAAYPDSAADDWKTLLAVEAKRYRPEPPIDGPIRVSLTFVMPRPGKLAGRKHPNGRIPHMVTPDLDNLEKAVFDVLTTLGFWNDDRQIAAVSSRKFYQAKYSDPPGVGVRIRRFKQREVARHEEAA